MQSAPPSDWRPSASLDTLQQRARLLQRLRAFFIARGVLEVETPQLSAAATTDPQLHSLSTRYTGPGAPRGRTLFLHTSPESPMKRLLAAGSGPIFQLCKVFRDAEAGRLHNPEFTLLEWYRPDFDHRQLMTEVAELVTHLLENRVPLGATQWMTYEDAFLRHTGLDPLSASGAQWAACARQHGIAATGLGPDTLDGWRDLLLTHLIEPHLGQGRLTFLYDYPASQAALARLRPDKPAVAERFELYLHGVELANGFHELGDAGEQRRRFDADLARRQALGLAWVPPDEHLLAALEHGLPACAGVALGVDRLVMLALGAQRLADVMAFPIERA
jgi:lysyl-tRNA synthetase class 2